MYSFKDPMKNGLKAFENFDELEQIRLRPLLRQKNLHL